MNILGLLLVVIMLFFMMLNMYDGIFVDEVCRCLEEVGVDVVGLNCGWGFEMMVEFLKIICKVCKVKYI